MTTIHDGRLMSYDDSWDLGRPPLKVAGQFALPGTTNFDVYLYPDVKTGHISQSPDPIFNHTTIYWNIPHVIAHGRHYASLSTNADHLARASIGHTEVYELDNFYELLDTGLGWEIQRRNFTMVVPVFYPFDGSSNHVLSIYDTARPRGRRSA